MHFVLGRLILLFLLVAVVTAQAQAQRRGAPKIENKQLATKDGVKLAITYYPSSEGKNATPVVLLHDLKETRQSYRDLAKRLSQPDKNKGDRHPSFAVVTVDLRGHGESVTQTYRGQTRELNASKLRSADFAAMVSQDLAAVRSFLVVENDAGRLNLNRMSFIGVGLGASVAFNYTGFDWMLNDLPNVKQSKDVKTLITVSPRWKQNGLSIQEACRVPGLRKEVAVLMMFGEEGRRINSDVNRIYKQLERDRELDSSTNQLQSLMKAPAKTELQGDKWLKKAGEKGQKLIIDYLTKFSAEPEFDWVRRKQF